MFDTIRLLGRIAANSVEVPCLTKGLDLPCWIWRGSITRGGYGQINVKRSNGRWQPVRPHRAAYEALISPIPDGLEPDHLCRVRACWNPWHMDPVTRLVNVRRGIAPSISGTWQRARTRCPAGHPYDEANTHLSKSGRRQCRACGRERARRNSARKASK